MSLVAHAETELRRAGLYDADADYGGMIPDAVLALMRVFAEQGHSGGSAWLVLSLFEKLARFEPLTPITTDPAEWMEVSDGMWQNRRKSTSFSTDGGATHYDLDADGGARIVRPTQPA